MITLGIDEAGRGPILGPMVLAAVALHKHAAGRLTRAGVSDSKWFGAGKEAHEARCQFVPRILDAAQAFAISVVSVEEIDAAVAVGGLNRLERQHARRMLNRMPTPDRIIADGRKVFGPLATETNGQDMLPGMESPGTYRNFRAVDNGEQAHVAVAAASILAKVRRDELWFCIAERYRPQFGEVRGMGYVNRGTYAFLRRYMDVHGDRPPEGRRSWPWTFLEATLGSSAELPVGIAEGEATPMTESMLAAQL